uniref:Uncharacterized protein LOC116956925 n=1 Tax=Petromyzon marinus TaxID=7757 RepID=A0AAJ7UDZ9_PETMA|nr:uncharacterized protein LOC116956925 [Petromyzon marinus]
METSAKQTDGQPSQASGNIVKKKDVYMEDVTIVLPIVKNGVSGLGELWNCHSSETIHQNLFKKQLESEHLISHPLKKLEYSLTHIKGTEDQIRMFRAHGSMGLELLCGLIKVDGLADYSNKSVRSVNEEKLICQYNLENFSISLLPIAKTEIDDHVQSQLMKGRIKATHVAYGVILGAEVNAHVLVTRNETKASDSISISGSAVGKLGFGKVTPSLKAQLEWLDTSEANGYRTQIDIHSKPPMKRQPSTVKEMFELVENIDVSVANEQHYKFSGANIMGVPIRWVLVPIAQYLDIDVEKLYLQISETLLCDFRAMLISLQDSRQPECIKRRVLEKEHRLQRVLSDSSSPLSRDISQYEKILNKNVESLFICACKALRNYKQAVITSSELHTITEEYEMSHFSAVDISAKVDKFVMDGKHELDAIHEKDATQMEAEICIFTNRALLNEWMNTEANIKILLQTKGDPSSGVFHRLFKISHALKEQNIDVGIALPSISDNFSLTIKAREHQKCYQAADIPLILRIISAAVNTDSSAENQFYTIMASHFNITLPLQPNELKDLNRLVELLRIGDVHIASSYMESLECLWSCDSQWMFFVPIDALDTAYESIVGLRDNLKRLACANGKWVVGRLDIANQHEAPLLFVLRDKKVKAICLDHLDIMILVDLFNKAATSEHNEPDLSDLSPESLKCSIYHNRATYAVKTMELMHQANNSEDNYSNIRMQSFEDNVDEKFTDALHIVRSCLSRVDMDVIAMVTHFAIRDNPKISSILEKNGWRNVDCSFGKDRLELQDCELISTGLQEWLSSRDKFLTKVKSAKVIIQKFQLTSGSCTDDSVMRVNNAMQLVTDDPECPEYIVHEIQSLQESYCHDKYKVFLATADDYVVSSENQDGMTHVKALISISKRMYQNDSYLFNAYDAINIYVGRIDFSNSQYSSSNRSIAQCIEKRQLHALIQHLSKLQYNRHLVMLQLAFDKLKELNEPKAVVGVLNLLSNLGLQENQWEDLWTNSSFKYLIRRVIEDYDTQHKNKATLSRLDCIVALLSVADCTVVQEMLQIMTKFPMALPLVMPDLELAGKLKVMLPLLAGNTIKWEAQSGVIAENHLFLSPFRLILAVRLGNGSCGKSTILNQLMAVENMFSSCGEPGAQQGPPLTLAGTVEFTWLTQETCSASLWDSVMQEFYSQGQQEIVLLANLHGDALEHPTTLEFLKTFTSAYLIFLMPGTKNVLAKRNEEFGKHACSEDESFFLLVDPSADCNEADDIIIQTSTLTKDATLEKSSGKSTLLNALFACKFAVSVGRCTRGLFMRLLFLEEKLVKKLKCDAIVLIDTEGLGAPEKMKDENAEQKDRILATFAMSVSNLTLINVLGEYMQDLTKILQIAIVAMAQLKEVKMAPDILMVQHLTERNSAMMSSAQNQFCQAIEKALELTEKKDFDMGIGDVSCLKNLTDRIQNGKLLKQFRPFKNGASAGSPPSEQYHEDVLDLVLEVLNDTEAKGDPESVNFVAPSTDERCS